MSVLPEDLEECTLSSMMTGEIAYTVPWAMWVDMERTCWLHPGYSLHTRPEGTVRMRVELRKDGYHVWPPNDERWKPSGSPGYVGAGSDTRWLPVAELHRA